MYHFGQAADLNRATCLSLDNEMNPAMRHCFLDRTMYEEEGILLSPRGR